VRYQTALYPAVPAIPDALGIDDGIVTHAPTKRQRKAAPHFLPQNHLA
jgi:hypothetical protein